MYLNCLLKCLLHFLVFLHSSSTDVNGTMLFVSWTHNFIHFFHSTKKYDVGLCTHTHSIKNILRKMRYRCTMKFMIITSGFIFLLLKSQIFERIFFYFSGRDFNGSSALYSRESCLMLLQLINERSICSKNIVYDSSLSSNSLPNKFPSPSLF